MRRDTDRRLKTERDLLFAALDQKWVRCEGGLLAVPYPTLQGSNARRLLQELNRRQQQASHEAVQHAGQKAVADTNRSTVLCRLADARAISTPDMTIFARWPRAFSVKYRTWPSKRVKG